MALLPFVSAWILARAGGWPVMAALGAVLAAFLIREPLLVLLRQRYRWPQPRAETPAARRMLALMAPVLAMCGMAMTPFIPIGPLALLGGLATILTTLYLWAALNNRQRSPWLQAAGAAGLSSSAALCYLAAGREPDETLALLWAAHAVHGTASVLAVHARLDAIMASRRGKPVDTRPKACLAAQCCGLVFGAALAIAGRGLLGLAVVFPVIVHALDLRRLADPEFLKVRLQKVGVRELAISSVFSALVVAGLW